MKPLIVKLGGAILNQTEALGQLLAVLKNTKAPLVIVHGGGAVVDETLAKLQLPSTKWQGLRVTPSEQIDYIVGALAGTSNKLLLAAALTEGMQALGLCLSDANSCKVIQLDPQLGQVGTASPGDPQLFKLLLDQKMIPIVSSIGIGDDGLCYNVNADQAAVAIAELLQGQLVFLSDVKGVLDHQGELLAQLNAQQINELIESRVITDGMQVKVNAALAAAESLQQPVNLASWFDLSGLAHFIEAPQHCPLGTEISF